MTYARKPRAIASRVYAGRFGNGNEASGDGWMFRGRGLIQVTFRDNYRQCGDVLGCDLEGDPGLLAEPLMAALSAGWYWNSRGLNALADDGNTEAITRRINGGTNGMEDRIALYDGATQVLMA